MKRTHIMIAVFFACILSPNLLFPILKTTADEGTGENRSLAAFPTLSLETIDTFPSGVEDWINDHAAFRNRFLSLNARLNLSLFQFGDSQDVITGKDGWYFYTLGSSVEDFLGTNRFSAGELRMLAEKLQTVHDAWEKQGTEFIFLCAPNKEGVYSEFLPDGFTAPDGPTRRSELLDYLEIHTNVPVVNPYPELKNRREWMPSSAWARVRPEPHGPSSPTETMTISSSGLAVTLVQSLRSTEACLVTIGVGSALICCPREESDSPVDFPATEPSVS